MSVSGSSTIPTARRGGCTTSIAIDSPRSSIRSSRLGSRAYAKGWRALDKEANDYVDRFVANSELVRDRIRRFYDRDATVVYPPVTGDWRNDGDEGYFVTWSRLAPRSGST